MFAFIYRYLKTAGYGSALPNFNKVTNTIYRGGLPKDPEAYVKLRHDHEIGLVINLIDGDQSKEMWRAEDAGLFWFHLPLSDKTAPRREDVERFIRIMKTAIYPVFVHCKGGRHRTGLLIALYRVVVQGWDKHHAWEEAEKHGFYSELGHGKLRGFFFSFDTEALKQ